MLTGIFIEVSEQSETCGLTSVILIDECLGTVIDVFLSHGCQQ